jgi:hypothetical protein
LIIKHAVSHQKNDYFYFFCKGRRNGICNTLHLDIGWLEEVIEDHCATIRFMPEFITTVRAQVTTMLDENKAGTRLLHEQLTAELARLDSEEDNLISLAAGGAAQNKIQAKLHEIERQRARLTERLEKTDDELSQAARLIYIALTYLEDPQATYPRFVDHERRLFNQAIFQALYVAEEGVTSHDLHGSVPLGQESC